MRGATFLTAFLAVLFVSVTAYGQSRYASNGHYYEAVSSSANWPGSKFRVPSLSLNVNVFTVGLSVLIFVTFATVGRYGSFIYCASWSFSWASSP